MALFRKPDGTYVDVPDENAPLAVQKGYTPVTEAQYEASKQTLQAGLEGVGEGASFGFATPLVRNIEAKATGKTNDQVAEEMRLRKQENPVANTVGQIAGGVGIAALTAGVGPELGVGGRIAMSAAQGTLNGLGAEMTEATLENRDVLAEKLAMNGVISGLAGAGIGAGFEGIRGGINLAVKKLGGQSVGEVLSKLGDDLEWRTLSQGSTANQMAKNEPYRDAILQWGRKNGVTGTLGSAFDGESAAKVEAALQESGKRIGGQIERLEQAVPLDDNVRASLAKKISDNLFEEFGQNPTYREALNSAARDIEQFAQGSGSWKDAWEWQGSIFKKLEAGGASTNKDVARVVRNSIRDYAIDAAEAANPGQAAAMRAAAAEHHAASSFQDMFEKRLNASEKIPGFFEGIAEGGMYGALIGHPFGGALGGGLRNVARGIAKERGGLFASALLNSADSPTVKGIAAGLRARLGKVMTVAPSVLGSAQYALERAITGSDDELLATHNALANGPGGDQYLAALGYLHETPEDLSAVSQRMAHLDAIRAQGASIDQTIDSAVNGFFGAKRGPKTGQKVANLSEKDFAEKTANIKEVLADPSRAFQMIPPDLGAVAPGVMNAAASAVVNAYRFLDAKAPKDPQAAIPPALREPWKPSKADLERWGRYVDAAENPQKALEQMGKGVLTRETVEALEAVYPRMYAEMKQKIFEKMSTWERQVPYEQKLALSHVFGFQVTGLKPEQMALIQQSFASQQQPQGGSVRPVKDGRQDVDVQKNLQTQSQRLESR